MNAVRSRCSLSPDMNCSAGSSLTSRTSVLDGPELLHVALAFVGLGVETGCVGREIRTEITERPGIERSRTRTDTRRSACLRRSPEDAREKRLVDRLDDGVDARVLIVDVQADVRFARRRMPSRANSRIVDRLVDARRVLREVVEDERLQTRGMSVDRVAIEVDAQARAWWRCAIRGRASGCPAL